MVVIRLSRAGSNKNPFYRIMVADKRKPRDGRFIERVGYYNPLARGLDVPLHILKDRVFYWVSKGAQVTPRVQHLLDLFEKSSIEPPKETAPRAKRSTSKLSKTKGASKKPETAVELKKESSDTQEMVSDEFSTSDEK